MNSRLKNFATFCTFDHPPAFKIWVIFAPFSFALEEMLLGYICFV